MTVCTGERQDFTRDMLVESQTDEGRNPWQETDPLTHLSALPEGG